VIRIGKTPASADGDEARVSNLREDHGLQAGLPPASGQSLPPTDRRVGAVQPCGRLAPC
jgi:hypothetical protein